MKPVVFDQDGEAELDAAMAYYEGQQSGLGLDHGLQTDIARTIGRVRQHPQLIPLHNEGNLRKSPARRFLYVIFYLELEEHIWIVAVAHQRRRPGYWAYRAPELCVLDKPRSGIDDGGTNDRQP